MIPQKPGSVADEARIMLAGTLMSSVGLYKLSTSFAFLLTSPGALPPVSRGQLRHMHPISAACSQMALLHALHDHDADRWVYTACSRPARQTLFGCFRNRSPSVPVATEGAELQGRRSVSRRAQEEMELMLLCNQVSPERAKCDERQT
jgi:hypothetical protein